MCFFLCKLLEKRVIELDEQTGWACRLLLTIHSQKVINKKSWCQYFKTVPRIHLSRISSSLKTLHLTQSICWGRSETPASSFPSPLLLSFLPALCLSFSPSLLPANFLPLTTSVLLLFHTVSLRVLSFFLRFSHAGAGYERIVLCLRGSVNRRDGNRERKWKERWRGRRRLAFVGSSRKICLISVRSRTEKSDFCSLCEREERWLERGGQKRGLKRCRWEDVVVMDVFQTGTKHYYFHRNTTEHIPSTVKYSEYIHSNTKKVKFLINL